MRVSDVFKHSKESHIIEQLQKLGISQNEIAGKAYRELVYKLATERAKRE